VEELEALLAELAAASERLAQLDPADLHSWASAVLDRAAAVERFLACLRNAEGDVPVAWSERLRSASQHGSEALNRLALTREVVRLQLADLHRELYWIRQTGGTDRRHSPQLDYRG